MRACRSMWQRCRGGVRAQYEDSNIHFTPGLARPQVLTHEGKIVQGNSPQSRVAMGTQRQRIVS